MSDNEQLAQTIADLAVAMSQDQVIAIPEMPDLSFVPTVVPNNTEAFEPEAEIEELDDLAYSTELTGVFTSTNHIFNEIYPIAEPLYPPRPPKLERQTNNTQFEFGERPHYYAFITDQGCINRMLDSKSPEIRECLHSEQLANPLFHHRRSELKSKVVRYIVRATEQLNQLQLAGLIAFTKEGNNRTVHILKTGHTVTISFFLCDISGYIYTLCSIHVWYRNSPEYPTFKTPDVRALMNVLNDVLENKKKFFHTSLNFPQIPKPDRNLLRTFMTPVYRVNDGIFEHAKDIPEWVNDEESKWNFPETEPFEPPGILYPSDILEKLSLILPELAPASPKTPTQNPPFSPKTPTQPPPFSPKTPTQTPPQSPESPELSPLPTPPKLRREQSSDYATPFEGLRPLEPYKGHPFWNASNIKNLNTDYEDSLHTSLPFDSDDIMPPPQRQCADNSIYDDMTEAEIQKMRDDDNMYFSKKFGIPPIKISGRQASRVSEEDFLVVSEDEEPPYKKRRLA